MKLGELFREWYPFVGYAGIALVLAILLNIVLLVRLALGYQL